MSLKHLSLEHWSLTIIIHLSFILNVFQRTLPVFFRILFFWETVLRTQVNNKLSPFLFLFLISFLDFCLSVLSWNCNAQTMFSCSYRIKGIRKKLEAFSKEKKNYLLSWVSWNCFYISQFLIPLSKWSFVLYRTFWKNKPLCFVSCNGLTLLRNLTL